MQRNSQVVHAMRIDIPKYHCESRKRARLRNMWLRPCAFDSRLPTIVAMGRFPFVKIDPPRVASQGERILSEMSGRIDVAYYYPPPFWGTGEGGWVKSLLLFFDKVSILLPSYMYGRHHIADPVQAEPLEDQGLLEVLDPNSWIDEEMAKKLAEAVGGLLTNGVFDDLEKEVYFQELSQSRIGYGADVDLAQSLISELQAKGLAKPSEDGVSIPLHPTVRTTMLVMLAQLARAAGNKQNLSVHPTTNNYEALRDLTDTLARERMPSRSSVIAFDLEPVSFDMDSVPLDELLQFRTEHQDAHRTYMRDLRGFVAELAEIQLPEEREKLLLERRQEMADAAHDLQRSTRMALRRNLPAYSIGLAGAAWSATTGDPIGLAFAAAGLGYGIFGPRGADSNKVDAYSYLFRVDRSFGG